MSTKLLVLFSISLSMVGFASAGLMKVGESAFRDLTPGSGYPSVDDIKKAAKKSEDNTNTEFIGGGTLNDSGEYEFSSDWDGESHFQLSIEGDLFKQTRISWDLTTTNFLLGYLYVEPLGGTGYTLYSVYTDQGEASTEVLNRAQKKIAFYHVPDSGNSLTILCFGILLIVFFPQWRNLFKSMIA